MGRADSRRGEVREHTAKLDETLILEHEARRPRRRRRIAAVSVIGLVLVALAATWIELPAIRDSSFMQHRDANTAIRALRSGDLVEMEKQFEARRGEPDFAYFFASQATPRVLGDALGSAAGEKKGQLKKGVDPHQYELTLTDLAGTLALATYGTGNRALPTTWASDFATATTTPDTEAKSGDKRAAQDQADKQNLLLLLARGYWSEDFLKTVTKAYWAYDHDKGDDAWPGTKADEAKYAPAPNGTYLTDGILALTAALTANPAASAWAFTDFQPGTQNVEYDGDDHGLGNFSHYLFFEHQFPKSSEDDGDSLGMTATLTALSSAIDAEGGPAAVQNAADTATADLVQPMADTRILQGLAKSYNESSGCSWNPLDYGHCVVAVAEAVWHWIEHWGHAVLNILSLATFAPPPFDAIGVAAAVSNATWYAVEGDYAEAGLALAAAVPGLAFTKIAKAGAETAEAAGAASAVVKAGTTAERAVADATDVAEASARNASGALAATERELAEAGALETVTSAGLFAKESEAEASLMRDLPGSIRQKYFNPPGCLMQCTGRRVVDVWDDATKTAHEVKIGINNDAYALSEIDKDVQLLRDSATDLKAIVWHFYADAKGVVGPSPGVRTYLLKNGLPYVRHTP